MKICIAMAVSLWVLTLASHSYAEDGVLEFWNCTLHEGQTVEDAARVNGKWVKLQNQTNPDGGIRSWGLTPIVGDQGAFGYMDAYPSLDAWTKGRAAMETPAGQALEAELDAVATCEMNRLYQATEH